MAVCVCLSLPVSVTGCYGRLREVRGGYGRILAVSFCLCLSVGGYGRLREVTGGYERLREVTGGYRRLREVTVTWNIFIDVT